MTQNYEPKIGDKVVITVGERKGATGTIKCYAPVAVEGGYTRDAFWVDMDEYTADDWAIAQRDSEQYGMPLKAALPTYEFRATELAPATETPAQSETVKTAAKYFTKGEQVEINRPAWAGAPDDGERFDHWTEAEVVGEGFMQMDAFGEYTQTHIYVAVPGIGILTRHYQPGKGDEFIRKVNA